MTMAAEHSLQQSRYSVRYQARRDGDTHAKLEEWAQAFRRKRAAILRYIMQWGLTHNLGWAVDRSIPATAHPVTMLVKPALRQQVRAAAAAHGASISAWERHAMRQVTPEAFPQSWHLAVEERRPRAGRKHP